MTRARRIWLLLHRWIGLGLALVFVVLGLSGSFLAFYPEIDRALNPDWTTPQSSGAPAPMAQVLAAAQAAMPQRFVHSVFPPLNERDVHHVWLTPSAEDQSLMWEVLVDPHSAQVLGARAAVPTVEFTRRNLVNTIYTLHFQLFMGELGGTIVGFAGVFLLVSSLSGLLLWWPRGASFRAGLRFKPGARGIRFHFDLHRVGGIYSLALLALVGLTGVYLSFPAELRPVVGQLSPLREAPNLELSPDVPKPSAHAARPSEHSVNANSVMALAQTIFPDATVRCLWLPGASGAAWRVSLRLPTGVGLAGGPATLWVHPRSGEVLAQHSHRDASAGEAFVAWQLPLHGGAALGQMGRVLVAALGFVPLLLAITGGVIWWRKRRARRHTPG